MSTAPNARPIRVLRLIARLNMGGPALHVTYLAQGLAARGYETTLVAGDGARGRGVVGLPRERARGGVHGLRRRPSGCRDRAAARPVARALACARRARRLAGGAHHPPSPPG